MDREDIKNRFTYHAPMPGQAEKYELIREDAKAFALFIDSACPDSREKSLAITKLQECVMWANASIACTKGEEELIIVKTFKDNVCYESLAIKPNLPEPPPDRILSEDGKIHLQTCIDRIGGICNHRNFSGLACSKVIHPKECERFNKGE